MVLESSSWPCTQERLSICPQNISRSFLPYVSCGSTVLESGTTLSSWSLQFWRSSSFHSFFYRFTIPGILSWLLVFWRSVISVSKLSYLCFKLSFSAFMYCLSLYLLRGASSRAPVNRTVFKLLWKVHATFLVTRTCRSKGKLFHMRGSIPEDAVLHCWSVCKWNSKFALDFGIKVSVANWNWNRQQSSEK